MSKERKFMNPVIGVNFPMTDIRYGKSGSFLSVACSEDGNWLVFVDTKSKSHNSKNYKYHECFIWNCRSQSKLQLPHLQHPPESFFKCVLRLPPADLNGRPIFYEVYFFYKNHPSFIWSGPTSQVWESILYEEEENKIARFCDVVSFEVNGIHSKICSITYLGELITHTHLGVLSPNHGSFMFQRQLVVVNGNSAMRELFLIERKAQCGWEVFKIDLILKNCVSVPNLDGLVVLLSGNYSSAHYSKRRAKSRGFKEEEDEGNCICFTEDDDNQNFYVFHIHDQSLSIFRNQPHSGFPVWFANKSMTNSLGMPWLSFEKNDHQKKSKILEEINFPDRDEEIKFPDEINCDDLKVEDHLFSKLPDDLQFLVLKSLPSTMDYSNCRASCKKLRELAPPITWKPHEISSLESPWLMLFSDKDSSCSSFIDPSCNMRYFKNNQELSGCKILYSKDGWLLVAQDKQTVFFFEPFSKTKITVPSLPHGFHIDGISFSSSPTSPDCVIIAILSMPNTLHIPYLRSHGKEWVFLNIDIRETSFIYCGCNPVFHDRKFYILGRDRSLFYVSMNHFETKFISPTTDGSFKLLSNYCRGYLVSSENGLYLVTTALLGKFINVYKLSDDGSKWIEVKSIGNVSFFISQTSSFVIPVTKSEQWGSLNFPLFAENRCLSYKLEMSEFKSYYGDYSTGSRGLYERKELFSGTWIQPKVVRAYR